ncbi:MAG TPA: type II toxin-antitoxin system VapC family toxin [Bryobacteraceae bacterium]|nr:type II toxin-antitoxin system VapC family toxin [Bryobacteraceae bacterium]
MIVLDTSALIASLSGAKPSAGILRSMIERGERILLPSLVLYEWLRGPRVAQEISAQDALFPTESVLVFGPREAKLSAQLYKSLKRPRGREIDLAIAAYAIVREADLWTLNLADFKDIPHLRLVIPEDR